MKIPTPAEVAERLSAYLPVSWRTQAAPTAGTVFLLPPGTNKAISVHVAGSEAQIRWTLRTESGVDRTADSLEQAAEHAIRLAHLFYGSPRSQIRQPDAPPIPRRTREELLALDRKELVALGKELGLGPVGRLKSEAIADGILEAQAALEEERAAKAAAEAAEVAHTIAAGAATAEADPASTQAPAVPPAPVA